MKVEESRVQMKSLILLDKFYRYRKKIDKDYEKYLSRALIQLISEKYKDYDVKFEYVGLNSKENRPIVAFAGKDENFIQSNLKKEYGTVGKLSDLTVGKILRGRMRDPDLVNFGVFIDCGIEKPSKDILLPHYQLIRQLMDGKKTPKKKICKAFGFYEEMPVYVEITKLDKDNRKIECKLADMTIQMFNSWVEDGFEILFANGLLRKQIKRAIKKTKHYQDYLTIERLGFLETAVFLKKGTHAPGILTEIGPLLNAKFSMFRPSKVRHLKQM